MRENSSSPPPARPGPTPGLPTVSMPRHHRSQQTFPRPPETQRAETEERTHSPVGLPAAAAPHCSGTELTLGRAEERVKGMRWAKIQ